MDKTQILKRKQQPIDFHFQRTIKLKSTGVILKIMPSEIKEDLSFACGYPGCGKHFVNKGALSTHTKFAHPRKELKGSLHRFVVAKPRKMVTQTIVHPTMVTHHMVSWNSNLDVVPFIFPVLSLKTTPETKKMGAGSTGV